MNDLVLKEARLLHEAGKHQAAMRLYQQLLQENSNCEEALYGLALIQAESGHYADAILYLKKLLTLNQYDPRILLSLANVYTFMKETNEAYRILNQLTKAFPDYAPGYHNLGVYFYRNQEWQNAIDAFKLAIIKKADYVDAYYHLGLICFVLARFEEGRKYFTALLQLDETHIGARFHLACIHLKMSHVDEALSLLLIIHKEHPYHFETIVNMSHCYLMKKNIKAAINALEKAVFISPDDTQVLYNLGVLSSSQLQYEKAIHYYELVLYHKPDDSAARYNLALIYLDSKQYENAKVHLQILVDTMPQFEEAHYLLAALNNNKAMKVAPLSYVKTLFDQYANHYDAHMSALQCLVPEKLYELYQTYVDLEKANIIELGIGTGKLGQLLKDRAQCLIGVDISGNMLAEAKLKNCYTALYQSDVTQYLSEANAQSVDCVISADCLLYLGDLQALVESVVKTLKPTGYFIFNVEKSDRHPYQLMKSGRFAHSAEYLHSLLVPYFDILHAEEITLRYQCDQPVIGFIYACKLKSH